MSADLSKLASLLKVDEVTIHHGRKGYALAVRIHDMWKATNIDHEDLDATKKLKLIQLAEHLAGMSDALNKALGRGDVRKVVEPEPLPYYERLGWRDVGGWKPYEQPGRQQQIQRSEPAARPISQPLPEPAQPTSSVALPSRFHAIVEELKKL